MWKGEDSWGLGRAGRLTRCGDLVCAWASSLLDPDVVRGAPKSFVSCVHPRAQDRESQPVIQLIPRGRIPCSISGVERLLRASLIRGVHGAQCT